MQAFCCPPVYMALQPMCRASRQMRLGPCLTVCFERCVWSFRPSCLEWCSHTLNLFLFVCLIYPQMFGLSVISNAWADLVPAPVALVGRAASGDHTPAGAVVEQLMLIKIDNAQPCSVLPGTGAALNFTRSCIKNSTHK